MYFLIQLMSLYLPSNLSFPPEPLSNPVSWKAGLPSLNDMKRRAEQAIRKSADELLKDTEPTDGTNNDTSGESTTAKAETTGNEGRERQGKLVTTSPEIIPIILPTHQGLPISNTWYSTTGVANNDPVSMGQVDMSRWFVLMDLARNPKLLENNRSAMVVAAANLPSAKWPEYFNCGSRLPPCESEVKALNNQPAVGRMVPSWKGKSTAEWDAAHKAYVDRYGKLLVGQAATLPQDIYVVTRASLKPYSAEKGGLPISSSGFLDGARRADDPQRRLKVVNNYTAAVPDRLAEALQCSPSQCE